MPLIEYYREQGNLHEVDGQREISLVTEAMIHALEQNGTNTA
jgi:adenylate kinase